MTLTEAAQKMLDTHGWFVVVSERPQPIGPSLLPLESAARMFPGSIAAGTVVIKGPATQDDVRLQCETMGGTCNPLRYTGLYLYRAVAE